MSHNSEPITIPHQPGKLDFQIVEKEVSVTQFTQRSTVVGISGDCRPCHRLHPPRQAGLRDHVHRNIRVYERRL